MSLNYNANFDFLKEKNLLLISEDKNLIKAANHKLYEEVNDLEIISSILNITIYSKYDLIIVDTDYDDVSVTSSIIYNNAKEIPIIFVTNNIENNILEFTQKLNLKNILLKNINLDLIKYYVYIALKKSNIINFNDGYYFDLSENKLFWNNKEVNLTSLETDLFRYLLNNRSKIISYEEIKNKVWKERKFTIYGMRNIINKIREKSYYDIITNISKSGYTIKNFHIFS